MTCSGSYMSASIAANIRGENPEVPVGLISRFPMLNSTEWAISMFHTYCAILLMIVLYTNFIGPKGTDESPAKVKFHMFVGRIFSWLIAPHYALVGLLLNYYAIMGPRMEDWLLGADITGWRAQFAYITPFGLNVLVATMLGFFVNRYKFMSAGAWYTLYKGISIFSIVFWFTFGMYVSIDQVLGGLGSFGLPLEKTLDGGGKIVGDANQVWFRSIAFLTMNAGMAQAGMDYVNYKVLQLISTSGNRVLSWKDQHKWAMINLMFQAGFIFGFFVATFPYCVYGMPDWTCLKLWQAAPIAIGACWPVFVHGKWTYSFIKALLGGTMAEFSKDNHAWDLEEVQPVGKGLPVPAPLPPPKKKFLGLI